MESWKNTTSAAGGFRRKKKLQAFACEDVLGVVGIVPSSNKSRNLTHGDSMSTPTEKGPFLPNENRATVVWS